MSCCAHGVSPVERKPLSDTVIWTPWANPDDDRLFWYEREDGSTEILTSLLLKNDSPGSGDPLKVISVGNASVGTVELVGEGSDQKVVFTPENGVLGSEGVTFNYTISDGLATDTTSVIIRPREIDGPPKEFTLAEDTEVVVAEFYGLRWGGTSVLSTPEHGQLVRRGESAFSLVYIPDPDFNGTDSFTLKSGSHESDYYTKVTVTVTPVDEPAPPVPTGSYIRGTAGADVLDQSAATSRVQIAGLDGNDTLRGGAGSDALNGGAGNDVISGGAGNDTITGGLGVDRLSGGAGVDTFLMARGDLALTNSTDLIFDFQGAGVAGGDVLRFTGFEAGSTLALVGTSGNSMVYEVQDAAGVSEGRLLVSAGGTLGQALTASDYVFA